MLLFRSCLYSADLGRNNFRLLQNLFKGVPDSLLSRNFRHQNAFEQAEMISLAALDPTIASRARRGEFVTCFDHFDFLQTVIN